MASAQPGHHKLCFFIAPIGEPESETRQSSDQVLKHLVKPTLGTDYTVERADQISRPGVITVQIIERIIGADLVIADLTDSNPNVYYELAIRHAFRKPAIHIISKGQGIPFDVQGMRYVQYDLSDPDALEEAQRELTRYVKAIEEGASVVSPVQIAQAMVSESTREVLEVKKISYQFRALDLRGGAEPRALELMRVVMEFARDFGYEVRQECLSFVYETSSWLTRGIGSPEFVFHEISILMECMPIDSLVGPSRRRSFDKPELELLDHGIDLSGQIAYSVCKYIRDDKSAEEAIMNLHDFLVFAILNNLRDYENAVLWQFSECERICSESYNYGRPFDAGLKSLKIWKEDALSFKSGDKEQSS